MSSFLFSPLCLDPLTGVVDFTSDAKPFHTKVVQAGVTISFADSIKIAFTEQLYMDLDQLFHTHTGGCKTEPVPCTSDGFESEVYDDEFGFEPTLRYTLAEYPVGTPTVGQLNFVGYSAHGNPVFVVAELCADPEPPCPEGFETSPYDIAYYDFSDPECIDSCNNVYVGPCSQPTTTASCTDNTPTTLATTFAEFLTIEDDNGIILDIKGSIPFDPIYAHNPVAVTNLEVVTAGNQVLYHG